MRIRSSSEQHGKNKDIIYILILLTLALCIGVYLINTTVMISKDGVTFIEYAKKLAYDPIETVKKEYQHPGYPFLIHTGHRIAKIVSDNSSLWSWIYSAQIMTLMFRLLAVVVLYFVGKEIVEPKFCFLAVLVFILLPDPAEYGSDALSDWPYLFFLAIGFWLLIRGAAGNRFWQFGFVGLAAGFGYLVRPECAQLVVFGFLWMALQLLRPKLISRSKAALALLLLLVGFLIPAGPYMKLKGAIFPKKNVGQFSVSIKSNDSISSNQVPEDSTHTPGFAPANIAKAFYELTQKVSATFMWFFLPALLVGAYKFFRQRDLHEPQSFFIAALIALNIPLLIWLYCKFGYISGRHILSLVILTIFFIPVGLQVFGNWLSNIFSKGRLKLSQDSQLWFFILLIAGLVLCTPKLLTPLHADKQSYREAARWLTKYTEPKDIVAVPDPRISFYAQRQGLEYKSGQIPEQAQYAIIIFKEGGESSIPDHIGKVEYRYVDRRNKKVIIAIHKMASEKGLSGEKKLSISNIGNGNNRF